MSGRDVGASIRQRLLNQAHQQVRPFQEILQFYAMERFLFRLSRSPFADQFVLKGALLLAAWKAPQARPTMDIDLAGRTSNSQEHVADVISAVCNQPSEGDGIEFLDKTIETTRIKEDAEYEGVRVRLAATLAKARIRLQIDIGFGDVIVPAPVTLKYPTLLDSPAPVIRAYSKETVIAEKLHALITLGLLNSRLKDYYDIALLARLYAFDGEELFESLLATFRHRGTLIEAEPAGLTEAYARDPARATQWRAFVRRSRFASEPDDLAVLVSEVRRFADPLLTAAAHASGFPARWPSGGPWETP